MYITSKDNIDFYIKSEDDPYFKLEKLEENSKIGLIINKVYNVLFTNPGELYGDSNFGVGLEYYLWETNLSEDYILQLIIEQINIYIPELAYEKYYLNVRIEKGNLRDIMIIEFLIENINIRAIIN